jgi:hypothetical protein
MCVFAVLEQKIVALGGAQRRHRRDVDERETKSTREPHASLFLFLSLLASSAVSEQATPLGEGNC